MNTGNRGVNEVSLQCENLEPPSWTNSLISYAQRVLEHLEIARWELSLLLCDNEFMQTLNNTYRGKNAPTDVLSFPGADGVPANGTGPIYAGDIVLALPFIKEQANEFGVPYEEEIRRMVVHGILHLSGYTHESNDFSTDPMLIFQEQIIGTIKETLF